MIFGDERLGKEGKIGHGPETIEPLPQPNEGGGEQRAGEKEGSGQQELKRQRWKPKRQRLRAEQHS